jgi:hypothetical protein
VVGSASDGRPLSDSRETIWRRCRKKGRFWREERGAAIAYATDPSDMDRQLISPGDGI